MGVRRALRAQGEGERGPGCQKHGLHGCLVGAARWHECQQRIRVARCASGRPPGSPDRVRHRSDEPRPQNAAPPPICVPQPAENAKGGFYPLLPPHFPNPGATSAPASPRPPSPRRGLPAPQSSLERARGAIAPAPGARGGPQRAAQAAPLGPRTDRAQSRAAAPSAMGRGGGAAHSQAAGRDGARRGEEHEAAAGAGDGGGASAPPRPRLAEAAATGPADGAPGGAPAPRRGRLDAWRLLQDAAAAHGGTLAVVDAHGGSGGAGSGGGVSGGAGAAGAGARVLTYAQLARRAAALAAALGAAGAAGRGSRLAVLMRNRAEVLEAHFAAAALHAVVVNVNTALAPEELAFVLADSGATTVLASDEFAPALTAALRLGAASRSAGGLPAPLAVRAVMWAPETGRAPPPPPPGAGALPWPAPPADDAGAAGVPADAGAAVLEFELEAGASEEDGYHMYYTRWVGWGAAGARGRRRGHRRGAAARLGHMRCCASSAASPCHSRVGSAPRPVPAPCPASSLPPLRPAAAPRAGPRACC
jgi:hypothetical protein